MSIKEITANQAKQMIDEGNTVLLDVREPAEHASKHIPNSTLHPVGSICAKDLKDHEKRLLVYCQKGIRGKKACEKLLADNPDLDVFNITGGIESWEQSGLATAKQPSTGIPLDRQVLLSIGVMLLIISALAIAVSPAFTWLICLMGVALLFAGVTGFCGLANVLAKMPWNQTR